MDEKYYVNLFKEFNRFGFDQMEKLSSHLKLMYLFSYYHYFDGDSSRIDEITYGDMTDRDQSDNIDGIYIDDDSDFRNINVIISVSGRSEDSPGYFKNAEKTFFDAVVGRGRNGLLLKLKDKEFVPNKLKPIEFIVITDYVPLMKERHNILKEIQQLKSDLSYVSYRILFGNDIENEILEIEDPKEYVDSATIQIDSDTNVIRFGEEKSMIVNVSAISIKNLYQNYGYRGLFSQNLRYYVKNAKIDSSIQTTIQERPDDFWYFNNGIIIICDDYSVEGKTIRLNHFSIINGGQTTYLLGETDFDKDFYLQCKIIKNTKTTNNERIDFISDVAEATNTQKPIKAKDLIANRREQRMLKVQLAEENVFCSIKRGQKVNKRIYKEPWQNTNNEEIAQLIYSYVYQQPGIARNNKATLTSDEEKYTLIFKKVYSTDLLVDLLKMKTFYKLWIKKIQKDNEDLSSEDEPDTIKAGLAKNGMMFMVAILGMISKIAYHEDYLNNLNLESTEGMMDRFSQYDIGHGFIRKDKSLDKMGWFNLFEACYKHIYLRGYNQLKSFKPNYSGYSNFTKTQSNYSSYVLANFLYQVSAYGLPKELKDAMDSMLYVLSDEDKGKDNELLKKYVNPTTNYLISAEPLSQALSDDISQKLYEYRTRQFKKRHIKAFEIFTNKQMTKIAKYGPSTIEDLEKLRCLNEDQLNLYGNDIIEIIAQTKANFIE